MTLNVLALPVDIPWKRLCVSSDMNDGALCDARVPPRWRSSIAIFSYEPPEEDQTFPDMLVSYLKVTCSITGYQVGREVQLDKLSGSYWQKKRVYDNYAEQVGRYYPCKGALLQVAVGRSAEGGGIHVGDLRRDEGPYFADFEPKKRELYELVTDTGETMSRSLESTQVRKGTTTADAHEVADSLDQTLEYDSAGAGKANPQTSGASWKATVALGNRSRDLTQSEISDLRTSDQAREARETYSHTTQLTQMYHQLNSYHVGTNRAMFFLLPRPHVVQSPNTFVNGPRELEGVQEFFLVVMRPKGMSDYCVEAYLETAHIAHEPVMGPRETRDVNWKFLKLKADVEDRDDWWDTDDDSYEHTEQDTDTYPAPTGWVISGYDEVVMRTGEASHSVSWDASHLTVSAKATAKYVDDFGDNKLYPASIEIDYVIHLSSVEQIEVDGRDVLFMTGRGLCCCPDDHPYLTALMADSVTFEKQVELSTKLTAQRLRRSDDVSMPILEANRVRDQIGAELMASLNSPARYGRGQVGLPEARFVGASVAGALARDDHPDNQPVADIPGIDRDVAHRLARQMPRLRRSHLLRAPIQVLTKRFGLTEAEAVAVRRAAVGLAPAEAGGEGPPAESGQS